MAFAKRKKKKSVLPGFLTEPSLFEDSEPTFVDNFAKRRVYVHLVPAPWSRVLLLSLVYALAINFVKLVWFEVVGRPKWYAVDEKTAAAAGAPQPLYEAYPDRTPVDPTADPTTQP
ncbi:MAG: hypothetical protein KDD69_02765 [Bdellovibrionales bacterium]|nr:hypothetical protein [Bdellovibrionales bacterium]